MDAAQTRVETARGPGANVLVIGRSSLLGELGPVLRALGTGIALGLVGMIIVSLLVR